AALRHRSGLEFVVAPLPGLDGEFIQRAGDRYSVSLFPFLPGRSYAFGPYPSRRLRVAALSLIARLHQATQVISTDLPRAAAPSLPTIAGRHDLDAFLADPRQPWSGGPFSEPARGLLVPRLVQLSELVQRFDRLAASK